MHDHNINKYLSGTATSEEEKQIEDWIISSAENTERFNLLKALYIASLLDESTDNEQTDKGYSVFVKATNKSSRTTYRSLAPLLKYAAILALIFGTGYMYKSGIFNDNPVIIVSDDDITLELENGTIEVIKEDRTTQVIDADGNLVGVQKGSQLIYSNDADVEELVYNTITVPYGKRFDIILSDGTHVFLNTGTSFKYPIKFIKGENRKVFLHGEAFFDVATDAVHPFVVNMDKLNVRVLGTSFNITSYPEDEYINTTLVEGSVRIYESTDTYTDSNSSLLEPGHKAEWNKSDGNISIQEADVALYTAWVSGKIVFRHLPFENIIKKLERHYNVSIINNNKALDQEFFTASFDVETIEQVLKTFSNNYKFNYIINDNEIIIN